jgi:TPR repeat protein
MKTLTSLFLILCAMAARALPADDPDQSAKLTPESFSILLAKAKTGDENAENELADAYLTGNGTHGDTAKAVEWYMKSANQGNHEAEFNIGLATKWE